MAFAKFIVVVSLVIEHEGAVLLARRHPRSEHAPGAWDVISGRVESGESPHEAVGSSRVDLQACKLEYSIVSPK